MKKMSLNFKVGFVLFVAIFGGTIISGIGIKSMNDLNDSIGSLISKAIPRVKNAYRSQSTFRQMALYQANFLLQDNDKEKMQEIADLFKTKDTQFKKQMEDNHAMSSDEGKKRWVIVQNMYEKWREKAFEGQKAAAAGKGMSHYLYLKTKPKFESKPKSLSKIY